MDLDDNLKRLMKELGTAINDSLSDSEPISQAISNIRGAGYDVFLILEATIGFNRKEENDDEIEAAADEPSSGQVRMGSLKLTNQDARFLQSLKISIEEKSRE